MIVCVFCAHELVEGDEGLVHPNTGTWACEIILEALDRE